ncbi:MAG TPA: hypothetical protein VFQ60_00935 [Patescibacteria group bacterium]|nr:hypothetical protein [Patescibacteria group bacterium]
MTNPIHSYGEAKSIILFLIGLYAQIDAQVTCLGEDCDRDAVRRLLKEIRAILEMRFETKNWAIAVGWGTEPWPPEAVHQLAHKHANLLKDALALFRGHGDEEFLTESMELVPCDEIRAELVKFDFRYPF